MADVTAAFQSNAFQPNAFQAGVLVTAPAAMQAYASTVTTTSTPNWIEITPAQNPNFWTPIDPNQQIP